MAATTKDILTDEDAVRAQVEDVMEQRNVFREAFRDANVADANSDTVYFLIRDDDPSDVQIVPEGQEFPRDMSGRHKVPVHRDKYGEEFAITMEAERDGLYNDLQDEADSKMRRLAKRMDTAAFNVLANNLNGDANAPVGDGAGDLTYADVVDASMMMADAPYNFEPDTLFVGPTSYGDLLKSEIIQKPDSGQSTIQEGQVGQIAGIGNVYLSTSGALGAGEAIMVDSDSYGREATWAAPDTQTYTEEKRQVDVMQMWTLKGWGATQPEAAIKIES